MPPPLFLLWLLFSLCSPHGIASHMMKKAVLPNDSSMITAAKFINLLIKSFPSFFMIFENSQLPYKQGVGDGEKGGFTL